ncbi:hypothetical protein AB0C12_33640 [Actinoplanes sp. NPDC048967]|uniref:TlpA family protein disulfide reductase n=1 Tax=Actinoplanes sp. NPDC048967 TaxID=3155269 RepID=UPI0033CAC0F3
MTYSAAFLTVAGLVAGLNLVLTLGVIRRLRRHAELIAEAGDGRSASRPSLPPAGETPREFSTLTVDHERIDRTVFGDLTLLGFFSPSCPPCQEQVDPFIAYANAMPEGHRAALAVVVGTPAEAAAFVERLRPVARVVVEPLGGPVSGAFDVDGLPAVGLVGRDGAVIRSSFEVAHLPALEVA